MNLSPNGQQRLAAMKKTLAAGLPLAGLLVAATACSEKVQEGADTKEPPRRWIAITVEDEPMGLLEPPEDMTTMGFEEAERVSMEKALDDNLQKFADEAMECAGLNKDFTQMDIPLPSELVQDSAEAGNLQTGEDVVIRLEDAMPEELASE